MRAVRGATCLTADDSSEMREAVKELIGEMLSRNGLTTDDLVSMMLTGTPDLTSAFPAVGARDFGLTDVPLMCAQEMNVDGALARVVRIMMHVNSTRPRVEIQHVYLRGAQVLRTDLPQRDSGQVVDPS